MGILGFLSDTFEDIAPWIARPLDVSGTPHVPMSRLAKVEFRKALDTRAGRWFVISILALVVVVEVIYAFAANDDDKNFQDFVRIGGFVLGYFLPIIIIMLVTSEASQRNGLVTFTLEPKRSRVVVAKFIAGVAAGAARAGRWPSCWPLLGTLFGIVTGASPEWSLDGNLMFNGFVLSNLIGVFIGFAIAMLIMNTAGGDRRLLRLQPDPADRRRHPQRAQRHLRGHRAVDRVQHRADARCSAATTRRAASSGRRSPRPARSG